MPQFLVVPDGPSPRTFRLTGDEARHAALSMRLRSGDAIDLFDGKGGRWRGRVESAAPDRVEGAVVAALPAPQPARALHLYPALLSKERFEWTLEKATELGVAAITPILTERTEARPKEASLERWSKVVLAAAKQCGLGRLPELGAPLPFAKALAQAGPGALLAWEEERTLSLREALSALAPGAPVACFIGPEGGFSGAEAAAARAAGARAVSLGTTVLRAETAAAAAAALILL